MLQPTVRRTWAPRGQTPVHRSWDRPDRFSTHGAITVSPKRRRLGFYFHLQGRNVKAEDVVAFIRQVRKQLGWKRLVIVWDRLGAHRKAERNAGITSSPGPSNQTSVPAEASDSAVVIALGIGRRTNNDG